MSGYTRPSTDTAMSLAKAFGITVEDLYAEPKTCLAAALPHLYDAPVSGGAPEATDLEPGAYEVVTGRKVTPLRKKS